MTEALTLADLDVAYRVGGQDRQVLRGLSLRIGRGESYGLVGESGCGKSTTAQAITRYMPRNGRIRAGSVKLDGADVLAMPDAALRRMRANAVSMVYQDPGRALNPTLRIGRQVAEVFETTGIGRAEALDRTAAMLARVRIADPAQVMQRYPHQLSGGMQQRVAIAMALAVERSLIILDEPTTGLDATVEAEVLDLIESLRREHATSVLFISHNLGVIARMCDRVGVLYAGKLVEEGPTAEVFEDPRHPYTVGLLRCLPRRGRRKDQGRLDTIPGFLPAPGAALPGCVFADRCAIAQDRCVTEPPPPYELASRSVGGRLSRCHFHDAAPGLQRATPEHTATHARIDYAARPILRLQNVVKTFGTGAASVRVLHGISLALWKGETLGLVGESGSGKTTLARLLLGLLPPDAGSIVELDGREIEGAMARRTQAQRKSVQIVFQNPDSALNRAQTVRRLIGRTLGKLAGLSGRARIDRMLALCRAVRLPDRILDQRPRQLSGGLKQRVAIARAFAGDPRAVVCDEPTSALDVSVQAAILNLLADLQAEQQVSYLFISHDLGVVRYLSDRIAVLYLGRILEIGPAEQVFAGPHHPYTEALLSAVPSVDGRRAERIRLSGEIPSAAHPPSGCVFHTRCPRKLGDICEQQEPGLDERTQGHALRCHLPTDALARADAPALETA